MKLPGIQQRTGVQSLGRENINLPAARADAESAVTTAATGLVADVAEAAKEYDDYRTRMQMDQANQNLVNRDAEWRAEHEGREFYESRELPPEIAGDDERERIPAYEVQHELYNMAMQSWIDEESVGIKRKRDREFWTAEKDTVRNEHYGKAIGQARSKQLEFDRKRQDANYEDAITRGQWDRAIAIGQEYPADDVTRETLVKGARTEKELSVYRESMRLEDVESMQEHIQYLNEQDYNGQLDSAQRLQMVKAMEREIAAMQTRGTATANAERANYKDEVNKAVDYMMDGGIYPPEYTDSLLKRGQALYKPGEAHEYQDLEAAIRFSYEVNQFNMGSEAQRAAMLKDMKAGISNAQDSERYQAFSKAHENAKAAVNSDMMAFAEKTGVARETPIVPNPQLVQGTNVSPFSLSLEERMREYEVAAQQYGFGQGPLKANEVSVISSMIQQSEPAQQFAMLQQIENALGDKSEIVFEQLNTEMKGSWPHAGKMFGMGNITAARHVIDGSSMRKADPKLIGETKSNLYMDLTDLAGPIYGLDVSARSSFNESVLDMYAYIATTEGLEPGAYDTDVLERAVERVTGGGMIEYNGYNIVPPAYGLGPNTFNDWADNIMPAHIEALGGVIGMSNDDVAEVIREGDYRLVNVGASSFALQYNGSGQPTGTFLMNKTTGEPFIIDYTPAASMGGA